MTKKGISLLFILLIIINTASCKMKSKPTQDNMFAMDTYITFNVSGGPNPRAALTAAMDRIKEIEQRMSAELPDSDISKINDNAGKDWVKVHPDTFFVIQNALKYAELTHGAFDITMLPVSRLWNIGKEDARIPSEDEIKETLPLIDYKKIKLNEEEQAVFLESEGMAIGLGAIAKGYAGDEVVRILKENGVTSGLINLGGNIVVVNGKSDGTPWRIGIKNPRMEEDKGQGKHVMVVETDGNAVVTSGDYERYMVEIYEETGERYHHIFDPKTGYPAKNGVISVTVITNSSLDADALATSIFVLGVEEGLKLANELNEARVMIITEDKEIYFSNNSRNQVSEIHSGYHVAN